MVVGLFAQHWLRIGLNFFQVFFISETLSSLKELSYKQRREVGALNQRKVFYPDKDVKDFEIVQLTRRAIESMK